MKTTRRAVTRAGAWLSCAAMLACGARPSTPRSKRRRPPPRPRPSPTRRSRRARSPPRSRGTMSSTARRARSSRSTKPARPTSSGREAAAHLDGRPVWIDLTRPAGRALLDQVSGPVSLLVGASELADAALRERVAVLAEQHATASSCVAATSATPRRRASCELARRRSRRQPERARSIGSSANGGRPTRSSSPP